MYLLPLVEVLSRSDLRVPEKEVATVGSGHLLMMRMYRLSHVEVLSSRDDLRAFRCIGSRARARLKYRQ
jgi:hypothetical protein